ncbi:MAG TPA: alpha/beta hydrolase [Saprospiraceae bacterium]|nr:alpha/beta hydrolase [Saprospiraceae bacterium]
MKTLRQVLRFLLLLLLVIMVAVLVFIHVYDFKMDQEVIDRKLSDTSNVLPEYDTIQFPGMIYPLTKLDNNLNSDSIVFFLHGSPGNVRDYLSFYEKDYDLDHFRLIAAERPGYSSASFGNLPLDLQDQVEPLAKYIETLSPEQHIILVSHSYGGAPAGLLAAQHPDLIDGLLLGAALIDPNSEPVWWFNHLFNSPMFNWMLPKFLSMANKEKMAHAEELKKIEPIWPDIKCPVYLLHGTADRIAPIANVHFAQEVFSRKDNVHYEIVEDMNHLIQIQEQERMAKGIKWLAAHNSETNAEKK